MRKSVFFFAAFLSSAGQETRQKAIAGYGRIPLHFERNEGQYPAHVAYLARGPRYRLALGATEAVLEIGSSAVTMRLTGANPDARISGADPLEGKVNHFIGNDPAKWRTGIATYGRVRVDGIYPGIDLVYYGNQQELEYDLVVHPGVDPRIAEFEFAGAKRVRLDESGALVLEAAAGDIRWRKPLLYQGDQRREVRGEFELRGEGRVGFKVGEYDRDRELVIDPVLEYTISLPGYAEFAAVAADSSGHAYVAGHDSYGILFGGTGPSGAYTTADAMNKIFVAKINPAGTAFTYLALVGGSSGNSAHGIAVDSQGRAFVAGGTLSSDFPLVLPSETGRNAASAGSVYFGLSPAGDRLILSSYDIAFNRRLSVGGSNQFLFLNAAPGLSRIQIADGRKTHVTRDRAFSFAAHPSDGSVFAIVDSCNIRRYVPDGDGAYRPDYTTSIRGSGVDSCEAIAVDNTHIYLLGSTTSPDLPVRAAHQAARAGGSDFFAAKIAQSDRSPIFLTYIGGPLLEHPMFFGAIDADGGELYFAASYSAGIATTNAIVPNEASLGIGMTPSFPDARSTDGGQSWTRSFRPPGSRGLLINPIDPNVMYLPLPSGGLQRSTDGGATWTVRSTIPRVTGFSLSADGRRLYGFEAGYNGRLYRSDDDGANWAEVRLGEQLAAYGQVVAHATNPNAVFAGHRNSIHRSLDAGATWTRIGDAQFFALHPTDVATLWAAFGNTLRKTVDGGATWTVLSTGLPSSVWIDSIVVSRSNPSVAYCVVGGEVYRTANGGATWTRADIGLPIIADHRPVLSVDPSNPDVAYATLWGVFKTTDGMTWRRILEGPSASLTIHPLAPLTLFVQQVSVGNTIIGRFGTSGQMKFLSYFLDPDLKGMVSRGGSIYLVGDNRRSTFPTSQVSALGPILMAYEQGSTFVAKIGDATPACTYRVESGPGPEAARRKKSIWVYSPSGCRWTATPSHDWISILSNTSGTGVGELLYVLDVNPGGTRSGSITVGGVTVPITQAGSGCTVALSESSRTVSSVAGSGTLTVAAPLGCPWALDSGSPWIHVSPTRGAGNGSLSYSYSETEYGRYGFLTVFNGLQQVSFDLTQQPPTCAFTVKPVSLAAASSGASVSFDLTAPGLCPRFATAPAWLTLLRPLDGTGPANYAYRVAPNFSPSPRTGTITIAGKTVTVTQAGSCPPSGCPFAGPLISAPTPNLSIPVSGVSFQWGPLNSVVGYQLRIAQANKLVFEGSLLGANATNTLVSLPHGSGYTFAVRGCFAQPFADGNCGAFSTVDFQVNLATASPPTVTAPSASQQFTSSTHQFRWTAVPGAQSYEIELTSGAGRDLLIALFGSAGNPPPTETVYSMHSGSYSLRVRSCAAACGAWSSGINFTVTLPAVPTQAPNAPACTLNASRASCSWNAVVNADIYTIQAIHPTAGPGGGALTVASRRVPTPASGELLVPTGPLSFLVAACNGDGCGPYSAPSAINATAPNPSQPILGSPIPGSVVSANPVLFSWNRIPGDNGSNTVYRLYVQDLSRGAPALDVLTRSNFYAAAFKGEGSRYDAIVAANPDTPRQVIGPASGFVGRAFNPPPSPTMVQPRHQQPGVDAAVASGNVLLGWTPVPGATLYEYFVAQAGQPGATARGITPGLFVQVPLPTPPGSQTTYSGIVRACPETAACEFGSDAGWGPWSNAPGGPGVTTFLVKQ